jgi:hypothetical protein
MASTLLGSKMSGVQNAIAQKMGLPSAVVGQILAVATSMIMGHVHKMFAGQKMDQKSLSSTLDEEKKKVMQSSPEAASIPNEVLDPKEESSGFWNKLKKSLGS